MSVDIDELRDYYDKWRANAPSQSVDEFASLMGAYPELLDEVARLRETLTHTCTCSLADGAAPALRHETTCELRIAKTKRIDPALALSRFAKAMDESTEDEVDELKLKLAATLLAKDDLADIADRAYRSMCRLARSPDHWTGTEARIAELRAVGREQP